MIPSSPLPPGRVHPLHRLAAATRRRLGTIAGRTLILFAFATLVPLAVALIQARVDALASERRAFDSAQAVARAAAAEAKDSIEAAHRVGFTLARLPSFWDGTDEDRDQILAALAAPQPVFTALVYFTADFHTHGASNHQPGGARPDVADRPYAHEVVRTGQLSVTGEAYPAISDGNPVLPVALPLHEAGPAARSGFLMAEIKPGPLPVIWTDLPLPPGSSMVIIDTREGRALAGTGIGASGAHEPLGPAELDRIGATPRASPLITRDGVQFLRAWQPVSGTTWMILADIPSAAVLGPIYANALRRAALSGVIAAAALVLLIWLWRAVAERRRALQVAAARWAQRQWSYRAGLGGTDELAELGRAFDAMAAQVQATVTQTELILNSVGEGIFGLDRQGRTIFMNPAGAAMLGYQVEELLGTDHHQRWHHSQPDGSSCPPEACLISTPLADGAVHQAAGDVFWRKDGSSFPVEYISAPLRADGAVVGAVVAFKDITERQVLDRLKDEFVSVVSHELRTPMAGLLGYAELLDDTDLTPQQRRYVDTLRRSGDALLALVNDILDYSKIQAGRLVLEVVDFEVREVIEDVTTQLAVPAHGKGLELVALVDREVPRTLRGDPGRLRQILLNLVGNAVKFTEQGEVVVHVILAPETEHTDADRRATGTSEGRDTAVVRFEVRDTGIGIRAEVREQLFQPFAQADASTTREYGGTGLGLAICKRLVELMGGAIGVESEPGQGSTFWCTARFELAPERMLPTAWLALRGLRVLVVHRDTNQRRALQEQLAAGQLVSAGVPDGASALACLRSAAAAGAPYAAVLVDAQPREEDGLTLARAIRADLTLADTRLILLTRFGASEWAAEARLAGVDATLMTPVRRSQLFDTLAQVVAGPGRERGAHAGGPTPPEGQPSPPVAPPLERSAPVTAPRILVVDDSPINRELALQVLDALGYQADAVHDGRAALEALARQSYAAVLMDCQMPGLDGFMTSAEIRRREGAGQRTPIIALTANAMQSDRERCLAAGMDDYLAKPFRKDALDSVLRQWVQPSEPRPDPSSRTSQEAAPSPEPGRLPVIDETVLAEQFPDEPDLLVRFVDLFVQDTPQRVAALREALERGDPARLRAGAHTIKGAAGAIGARELQALCAQLEALGATGTTVGADELVAALEPALQRLQTWLERQPGPPQA